MCVDITNLVSVNLVTIVVSDTMMFFVMIEIVMFLNVKKDTHKFALIIETLEYVNTTMKSKMHEGSNSYCKFTIPLMLI
jgi:hypothetical protein